VAFAVLVSTSL